MLQTLIQKLRSHRFEEEHVLNLLKEKNVPLTFSEVDEIMSSVKNKSREEEPGELYCDFIIYGKKSNKELIKQQVIDDLLIRAVNKKADKTIVEEIINSYSYYEIASFFSPSNQTAYVNTWWMDNEEQFLQQSNEFIEHEILHGVLKKAGLPYARRGKDGYTWHHNAIKAIYWTKQGKNAEQIRRVLMWDEED